MMKVLERFPQIGGIQDYTELPKGERFIYEQYTMDALQAEARQPVLKISK